MRLWQLANQMPHVASALIALQNVRTADDIGSVNACGFACQHRMSDIALELLDLESVREKIPLQANVLLSWACENRMEEVAQKILDIPSVRTAKLDGALFAQYSKILII